MRRDPSPLFGRVGRHLGILIDLRCRQSAGVWMGESPFIRFLQAFGAHFDQVSIFGRVLPGDYPVSYPIETEGVRFVPLPPYPRIPDLFAHPWRWWPKIDKLLASELPEMDALWLNVGHPVSIRALHHLKNNQKTRCFGVMRGAYANDARHHERGLKAPLAGLVMRGCLRLFAHQATQRALPCLAYGPQEVRWLQAHGVPSALVYDTVLTAEDLRGEGATPSPAVDILSVGRLDPVKGFDLLIEAIAPLRTSAGAPARLRIVGSGSEERRLKAKAAQIGLGDRVSFAGHVAHGPDLFGQYLSATIYAQPSHSEGTPKTVIEALGFGLPVVASEVGAMGELLRGPPAAGLLVPAGEVYALRQALGRMLEDKALRARCRESALQSWGDATMEQAVSDLLREASSLGRWAQVQV